MSHSRIVFPKPSAIQPNLPRGVGFIVSMMSGVRLAAQSTYKCRSHSGACRRCKHSNVNMNWTLHIPHCRSSAPSAPLA